jgi:hypothetical protein
MAGERTRFGQWVIVQRTKWGTLSEDRRQRLSSLPGWTTDVRETQWDEGFRHLQAYVTTVMPAFEMTMSIAMVTGLTNGSVSSAASGRSSPRTNEIGSEACRLDTGCACCELGEGF